MSNRPTTTNEVFAFQALDENLIGKLRGLTNSPKILNKINQLEVFKRNHQVIDA